MTIRIDSRWPLVWRDPHTLQVGIDPPRVVLSHVSELEERLISALTVGMTRDGLTVLGRGHDSVIDHLLERLAPVLQAPTPRRLGATVALAGSGRFVDLSARLFGEAGIRVVVSEASSSLVEAEPDLAVVVCHGVVPPSAHAVWLRRDVPHVPVLFTESAVHLGPGVEPGAGPCLVCIELHRRDGDAAWPTIATQLLTRARRAEPPALVAEAAAALFRLVIERLENGPLGAHSLRIATNGDRTRRTWTVHPDCTCGGLDRSISRERPESDSASVPGVIPRNPMPTTVRGSVARA